MIKIINSANVVSRYLKDITELADTQKKELGFIPYAAYEQSMYKGNLFTAVSTIGREKTAFAGYALLGGTFPGKRIFQLAVSPQYRHKGVGKALVEEIVQNADAEGFSTIGIKVGEQLPANKFWENMKFDVVSTKEGGQMHRRVNIRVREIGLSLFSLEEQPRTDLQSVADNISSSAQLYLLDTNILVDISQNREDSKISRNLLSLVSKGDIKVAIAQKAIDELERHRQSNSDHALDVAYRLPIFRVDNEKFLIDELKRVLFHGRENITQHNSADISHIATAISNNAKGFITRDKAILGKGKVLQKKFSIQVLSPTDFWDEDDLSELDDITLNSVVTEKKLTILAVDDGARKEIEEISPDYKLDMGNFDYACLQENKQSVAFCAIQKRSPSGGKAKSAVLFIPDKSGKTNSSVMLDYISRESSPKSTKIAVSLSVHGNSEKILDVLTERGYQKKTDGTYIKIFAGPIIGKHNWQEKHEEINRLSQISLPDMPPKYQTYNQNIPLGTKRKSQLQTLENFLSAVFLLPGRDGVIIPIRECYADAFFGHAPETSLFNPPESRLSDSKSYFRTASATYHLKPGKLLFFYQSKTKHTQGKVIAFARIVRSNIASKKDTDRESRNRGVLDDAGFQNITKRDTISETVFTHSVIFPRPVTLKRLREIGCGDNAQYVTAFCIDHTQTCDLLKEGGLL